MPRRSPVATIISCRQRSDTREETAQQLRAVGLEPHIVLSPCDPRAPAASTQAAGSHGNAAATAKALQHCLDLNADCLFCEDDLTLAPDFAQFLAMASRSRAVVWLCMLERPETMALHYPATVIASINAGEPMRRRLEPLAKLIQVRGSQCVYLPIEFLQEARIGLLPGSGMPSDWFIPLEAKRLNWRAVAALPNPVQHRHVRVARHTDRFEKKSRSYYLPRRE